MKKLMFLMAFIGFWTSISSAELVTNLPEVGTHHSIMSIEKTFNRENILMAYAKVKDNCEIIRDSSQQPLFEFYWLMDGSKFKAVNTPIRNELRKRMLIKGLNKDNTFKVEITALKTFKTDLPDYAMTIVSKSTERGCDVHGEMTLGPSDGNRTIRIESIFAETKGGLFPRIVSITVKGIELSSGTAVSRTYNAAD